MPSTLTYTGSIGPGIALTSTVFPNVQSVKFDIERSVIEITYIDVNNARKIAHVSYAATTTLTYTISAGSATITVS